MVYQRALMLFAAAVLLSSCGSGGGGSSPPPPPPPLPDVTGKWQGIYPGGGGGAGTWTMSVSPEAAGSTRLLGGFTLSGPGCSPSPYPIAGSVDTSANLVLKSTDPFCFFEIDATISMGGSGRTLSGTYFQSPPCPCLPNSWALTGTRP